MVVESLTTVRACVDGSRERGFASLDMVRRGGGNAYDRWPEIAKGLVERAEKKIAIEKAARQ